MPVSLSFRIAEILLYEYEKEAVRHSEQAIENLGINCRLKVVHTAGQLMEYLEKKNELSESGFPDIVLIHVNSYNEQIKQLFAFKQTEEFKNVPVIAFGSGLTAQQVGEIYSLHANCCICSETGDLFLDVFTSLKNFWLNVARLPNRSF